MSIATTVCQRSASFVMPICDPRDIFFYSSLILIMDSYSASLISTLRFFKHCYSVLTENWQMSILQNSKDSNENTELCCSSTCLH